MLSKATKLVFKANTYQAQRQFSTKPTFRKFWYNLTNKDDTQDPHFRAASFDPLVPLEGHKAIIKEDVKSDTKISKLKNGITVLSENPQFPNVVDLGILLDIGTRDETHETSGALLSIKNTYFKTVMKTNETVNYGMVQMSGGNFEMDYDQESTYWKANCLSHDVYDIFSMMADCALEPRSVPAANIGMEKNKDIHSLEHSHPIGGDFNDRLMATAYGGHGLGLPLTGLKHNVKYLHSNVLQKFQLENINPSRIFVCGAGIENHEEFVDLAEKTFGFIPTASGNTKQREPTKYAGGESRTVTEDNEIKIAIAFHSVPWKHEDMVVFNIINTLLGQSSSFSTGGPGKGMHSRTTKNLLNNPKYPFIESANAINMHFSDSGLFGLSVSGSSNKGGDIMKALVTELKNLTQTVPAEELTRAKNILKSHILMAMERQQDRLEESIKNIKTFGELRCHDYASAIDKITADQVNKAIGKIITGNPTIVIEGADAGRIPSYDKVVSSLKV